MKTVYEITYPKKINLSRIPTLAEKKTSSKSDVKDDLDENGERLAELQARLYANRERSILIIFQGMDTAGKDSAIKHVMSGVNPQGCKVTSFKQPSTEELDHDFLWKANAALPARGEIGIFNRSYYEEILITQVHPDLLKRARLPDKTFGPKFWSKRYEDILNFEKHLHRQGYEIIKIFLHISKDEQKRRLHSRFEDPKKLWKIDPSDVQERQHWKKYQHAYEKCLGNTASKHAPWYVVPGDNKPSARLAISKIVMDRMEALGLEFPQLTRTQRDKLSELKLLLK